MLTKDLHTKLSENKIPHYELLLYKGKEIEKKREQNQKEKQEEIEKQERGHSNQRKLEQNISKIKQIRKDIRDEKPLKGSVLYIDSDINPMDNITTSETRIDLK